MVEPKNRSLHTGPYDALTNPPTSAALNRLVLAARIASKILTIIGLQLPLRRVQPHLMVAVAVGGKTFVLVQLPRASTRKSKNPGLHLAAALSN